MLDVRASEAIGQFRVICVDHQCSARAPQRVIRASQHTVEVVSDPGEGAQKCGQIFGRVSAMMGNGTWTVEIIPAEIQPPPRTPPSASGNRVRLGTGPVTNWGDEAQLVVAFNEQVLLHRHRLDALAEGCIILIESKWAEHDDADIRAAITAIIALDGGIVAVAGGETLAALPLPLAGLLSDLPVAEVAARHHALEEAARDLGCTAPAPFALLSFMPLSVIPAVRVTDQGLVEL